MGAEAALAEGVTAAAAEGGEGGSGGSGAPAPALETGAMGRAAACKPGLGTRALAFECSASAGNDSGGPPCRAGAPALSLDEGATMTGRQRVRPVPAGAGAGAGAGHCSRRRAPVCRARRPAGRGGRVQ